jgi:predicted enzyme related to lactoylglutathione lyase
MPEITAYVPGTPNWNDVAGADLDRSRDFYTALFGWTADDLGEEAGHYTMFRVNGLDVAALGPQQDPSIPPHWTVYLASDDVDASVKKAEEAGGTVFVPPFDVLDAGRMAVVGDPGGATFGIWQAKEHIGARLQRDFGSVAWNELASRDLDKALEFYVTVFGYEIGEIDLGDGDEPYRELRLDGSAVAGAMRIGEDWPAEVPSHWMPYFAVEDADAVAARAPQIGGNTNVPPRDIPPGRIAVLSDPAGAHFSIIQPNPDFGPPS